MGAGSLFPIRCMAATYADGGGRSIMMCSIRVYRYLHNVRRGQNLSKFHSMWHFSGVIQRAGSPGRNSSLFELQESMLDSKSLCPGPRVLFLMKFA